MNANDRQVAGGHYRTTYQHWDMVIDLSLGYFEGQITKYVTRHRKKNGKQDLDKAMHFLDKLIESVNQNLLASAKPMIGAARRGLLLRYAKDNELNLLEDAVITTVVNWHQPRDLRDARNLLARLMAAVYDTEDAAEAGAGYVNQDR